MIAVVIAANLVSPISDRPGFDPDFAGCEVRRELRDGDPEDGVESLEPDFCGRHLRTASTEALHGWTCRGYENMTRTTIAALPIVDAADGKSEIALATVLTR